MADEPEQQESGERADTEEPTAAQADVRDAEASASDQPAAEESPSAEGEEQAKAPKRRRKPKAEGAEAVAEGAPSEPEAPAVEAAAEPAPEAAAQDEPAATEAAEQKSPTAEPAAGARAKPEVPGAHLEVDIVPEGVDPLGREQPEDPYAVGYEGEQEESAPLEEREEPAAEEEEAAQPIVSAAIDLAAGARYRATGKRKTAVARVILRPGEGEYTINGRALGDYFPRATLQRNICQPLEAVGFQDRMDVTARLHGGGVSSQAGALRHGISRALLEADPNLRGELKRRGFLTRDARVKERKKAGLKKARKRPQFSKR